MLFYIVMYVLTKSFDCLFPSTTVALKIISIDQSINFLGNEVLLFNTNKAKTKTKTQFK